MTFFLKCGFLWMKKFSNLIKEGIKKFLCHVTNQDLRIVLFMRVSVINSIHGRPLLCNLLNDFVRNKESLVDLYKMQFSILLAVIYM